jgi:hypothetical protein
MGARRRMRDRCKHRPSRFRIFILDLGFERGIIGVD